MSDDATTAAPEQPTVTTPPAEGVDTPPADEALPEGTEAQVDEQPPEETRASRRAAYLARQERKLREREQQIKQEKQHFAEERAQLDKQRGQLDNASKFFETLNSKGIVEAARLAGVPKEKLIEEAERLIIAEIERVEGKQMKRTPVEDERIRKLEQSLAEERQERERLAKVQQEQVRLNDIDILTRTLDRETGDRWQHLKVAIDELGYDQLRQAAYKYKQDTGKLDLNQLYDVLEEQLMEQFEAEEARRQAITKRKQKAEAKPKEQPKAEPKKPAAKSLSNDLNNAPPVTTPNVEEMTPRQLQRYMADLMEKRKNERTA